MATYFEQTVIQQTIPNADMTPLDRLLLSHIFDSEPDGEGFYFFAPESPATMIVVTRAELNEALAATSATDSAAYSVATEQLAAADPDAIDIDLDLSCTSWAFFLQDIVRRSTTLRYVSVVTTFSCSKMRPDGFGGMATLITPGAIISKSTDEWIGEFLVEAGLDREA